MSPRRDGPARAQCSPEASPSPVADVARHLLGVSGIAWAAILAVETDGAVRTIASCGDAAAAGILVPAHATARAARATSIRERAAVGAWAETVDPPMASSTASATTVAFFPVRSPDGSVVAVVALAADRGGPAIVDRVAALSEVVAIIAAPVAPHLRPDARPD